MAHIYFHRLDVRFRDCDPLGHVNNAVYLTYLEQARFAHWRALWGFGFESLPATRSTIKYPRATATRWKSGSISQPSAERASPMTTKCSTSGRVVASARTVQVMYDYRVGQPVPVPDDVRRKLQSN